MEYIEDLLPDFKDYLNNFLVLGIIFAIISPILSIFTLLLSPPFQGSGWTDWIIFGLIWFVAIAIFLFVKNRIKKEISRIYSESMGKYNELIEPARIIEKQIFMKNWKCQHETDQQSQLMKTEQERSHNYHDEVGMKEKKDELKDLYFIIQ